MFLASQTLRRFLYGYIYHFPEPGLHQLRNYRFSGDFPLLKAISPEVLPEMLPRPLESLAGLWRRSLLAGVLLGYLQSGRRSPVIFLLGVEVFRSFLEDHFLSGTVCHVHVIDIYTWRVMAPMILHRGWIWNDQPWPGALNDFVMTRGWVKSWKQRRWRSIWASALRSFSLLARRLAGCLNNWLSVVGLQVLDGSYIVWSLDNSRQLTAVNRYSSRPGW